MVLTTMTHASGAPIAALRLAAGLEASGHDVQAVFLYHREAMNGADYPAKLLLSHVPRTPADMLRIIVRLWRCLRANRPDVIIMFLPLASVIGANVARLAGIRRRIMSFRVPRATYSPVMRAADRLSAWMGSYTDVVGVSRAMLAGCAAYPRWLRKRAVVIHNGLKDWPRSTMDKGAARALFGLPAHGRLVGALGRLEEQKNPELLVEALAQCPAHVHLVLAGSGSLRERVVALADSAGVLDRLHLLGDVPREKVPHLLAAIDIFAQPSRFEGQSNALLEALHAGLPCLVSDIAEQVETVVGDDGRAAGQVLPLDDPTAWARAMANDGSGDDLDAIIAERAALFTFAAMMRSYNALLRAR
ncbi:MAG: glycosyltransferase family 4 protein [Sphingobium sp.]|uniref:glycosyltransferase family 4 protein n=1 Tax=Sphingobium sp. TaxID=1912891 RepID=UPI001A2C4EBD|nr:glycosyltransferase family 4 protein [Sphingobium sp.]MBJ7443374.1 glycosyltransferase family 4 protein [Sphingobium sp.]